MSGERMRVTSDPDASEAERFAALGGVVTYDIKKGTQLDTIFHATMYPDSAHDADYYTVPFAVVQLALEAMFIYPFE